MKRKNALDLLILAAGGIARCSLLFISTAAGFLLHIQSRFFFKGFFSVSLIYTCSGHNLNLGFSYFAVSYVQLSSLQALGADFISLFYGLYRLEC
jgi:hypothetical protein